MTESRSPLRRAPAAVLLLGGALALAGCGAGTRIGAGGTLRVALREYRVTPQKATVTGGSLSVAIVNDGRLTHSFVIATEAGRRVAASDPIGPGQATRLVVSLAPGHYVMTSGVQGDKADGLYGTLDVG